MKKLLLVLLALLMLVTMAGCDKGKVSDNWKDMEFKLAGEKYSFPLFFKDFGDKGWQLDVNEELKPGEYTVETYLMQNEDFYDEDNNAYAIIAVDFENYSDSAKKIKDCDIYWIFFSRVYNEVLKNAYELELAKGIKWGSTEQEIYAAYGSLGEDDKIPSEDGALILVYDAEYKNMFVRMVLYVDEEIGLFAVTLSRIPM
ncbi:MAG TPA: hypothetical protein PLI19_04350 [Erysipelotrichaceae bacterium]|mgnify:CR=1 FL=1|nr:hypothetical protein [Erysipelotrichaceae bacterium]HQB32545.1 hypothetical protein [Erysipelotrichaceae bacterium]